MLYVKHPETTVVCFDDEDQLKDIKIDWVMMTSKCVFQKIRPILATLGWMEDFNKLEQHVKIKSTGQQTLS